MLFGDTTTCRTSLLVGKKGLSFVSNDSGMEMKSVMPLG